MPNQPQVIRNIFGMPALVIVTSTHICGIRVDVGTTGYERKPIDDNRRYFLQRRTHRSVYYYSGRVTSAREGSRAPLE